MPIISGLVALLIYPSLQPPRSLFMRVIRLYLGFLITLVVYGCYLWWRIPDGRNEDENPGIEDYVGRGDVTLVHRWNDH